MTNEPNILVGKGETAQYLLLKFANRHGLIAGATGTGKTISLQVLAEGFSSRGIPVFMADVKGDLAGISQSGQAGPKLIERAEKLGIKDYGFQAFPTVFWDLFGKLGHPLRTTISDMGPLLLSRLFQLNETQEGVLNIAFRIADEQGLLLLDLKDLRAMLNFVGEQSKSLTSEYGNVTKTSVGAIQRRLLVLEQQGGENVFGEPALDLADLIRTDSNGYGYINILAAEKLMENPKVYATFMLWLMSELFEELPEVGDQDRPRLVFFFDEAHLLFEDAPKALLEKVEQVVRLIRSKGVGIYFVSQNPLDIPDQILGQLGNRIQHALRAFTPRDQKAVRAAAETFRPNPAFDSAKVITEVAVGEGLVSFLEGNGVPGMVQRALIRPPSSRIGSISFDERQEIIRRSPQRGKYDQIIDRESAYEQLTARAAKATQASQPPAETQPSQPRGTGGWGLPEVLTGTSRRQGILEAMAKSVARSIGSQIGREIIRGVLGSILRGK
jgi:DNA helicase HerA-like ATPase